MIINATIADIWRPSEEIKAFLYDISLIFCGSIFIALSAWLAVGWLAVGWPVPFTMQTFAVLMIGALFGANRASAAVLLYLFEGAAGLPVFSHGQAGISVFMGPTGGYLIGFLIAAYITGLLAQRGWDRRFISTAFAMLIGNIFIYTFGILRLTVLVGFDSALKTGLYPFIAGAIIKIILAAGLLPTGWKIINNFGFNNDRH